MANLTYYIQSTESLFRAETLINAREAGGFVFIDNQVDAVGNRNIVTFDAVLPKPKSLYLRMLSDPIPAGSMKCWPNGNNASGPMILGGSLINVVGYRAQ
jgi:hypothetical protein